MKRQAFPCWTREGIEFRRRIFRKWLRRSWSRRRDRRNRRIGRWRRRAERWRKGRIRVTKRRQEREEREKEDRARTPVQLLREDLQTQAIAPATSQESARRAFVPRGTRFLFLAFLSIFRFEKFLFCFDLLNWLFTKSQIYSLSQKKEWKKPRKKYSPRKNDMPHYFWLDFW